MKWLGHGRRGESGYTEKRILEMELPGKRKRGRVKSRFMGVVRRGHAVWTWGKGRCWVCREKDAGDGGREKGGGEEEGKEGGDM